MRGILTCQAPQNNGSLLSAANANGIHGSFVNKVACPQKMESSLSSLLARTTIEDHNEIIKACNAALKSSKNDIKTQHVKVVALLQLNRFDDAVRFFKEAGNPLKDEAQLEYAYALYKTGSLKEAAEVASKVDSRGAKHLQAQAVSVMIRFIVCSLLTEFSFTDLKASLARGKSMMSYSNAQQRRKTTFESTSTQHMRNYSGRESIV